MAKSGKKYRRWSWEEKRRAVERMKRCSPQQLAQELGIHKRQLYEWREQLRRHRGEPPTREEQLKREIQQLREALGKKALEVDFLQGALRRIEASCCRKQERNSFVLVRIFGAIYENGTPSDGLPESTGAS